MSMRTITSLAVLAMIALTCNSVKDIEPTTYRQMKPSAIRGYHPPVRIEVGWFTYQESTLAKTGDNEWKVVKNDETDKVGMVPQLLVTYPNSADSIWFDMNIDNALLGKLIKHSLMTQVPIERPFTQYFEVAACGKCHPPEVEIDFQ